MAYHKRPNDGLNAIQRYQAKLDTITIKPMKEEGEKIRLAADADGLSITQYILRAVREYMQNHEDTNTEANDILESFWEEN